MAKNPYIALVMRTMPVVLSKLDRDPTSPTYGCFDRLYWHYRIRDFVSMIEQQPVLALALVYSHDFSGNVYFRNKKIREYAVAAVNFWSKNLHADGSADEYWPNEHGYPPAVFPLYAVSEAYRILALDDELVRQSLLKGAKFISKVIERGPVNQEIASVAALYSVYLNTQKRWLLKAIERKLHEIITIQDQEGWFPEYGGADPGYLSVALDYIAEYYRLSNDKRVIPVIEKMLSFIKYFVHPDGSFGGEYGSRNTTYFLPNGLEVLSREFRIARRISEFFARKADTLYSLHCGIDDRYLCDYFMRSFAGALVQYEMNAAFMNHNTLLKLPCEQHLEKYFKHANIFIKSTDDYYMIVALSKGGVIKIYTREGLVFSDCGFVASSGKNLRLSTNWISNSLRIQAKQNVHASYDANPSLSSSHFIAEGYMHAQKNNLQTPLKSFVLRILAFFLGQRLIPLLKQAMITSENESSVRFKREILMSNDELQISDRISSPTRLESLQLADNFSLRYVPSSKFFQMGDIHDSHAKKYASLRELVLKRSIDLSRGKRITASVVEEKSS